jgi:hypothetical protein
MILRTYRINQKKYDLTEKIYFFREIRYAVLLKDRFWHFFFDPGGSTFRFSPAYEGKVRVWLTRHAHDRGFTWKKSTNYDPRKHEYLGVSFLGDDILPMFHELSVLSVKYPSYIITRPIFERFNHALINMAGIHNFAIESELYMDLAFSRARLAGHIFRLPKWCYKLYIQIVLWLKRYENRKLPRRTIK